MYNTEVLKSNPCNYKDVYIVVKGNIVTTALNNPTPETFKNYTPFIQCITKIDGTTINDAEEFFSHALVQCDRIWFKLF